MEDDAFGYIEEDIHEIVSRYERMRRNNENYFFDVAEFESIIDYYLDLNDVSYAFEAAESASKQHPEASSIQIRKAKVLIDKGRPVDALKIVRLLEKIEPSNFEIFIIKGAALGMLGDLTGTRKYFDIALSIDESEEINILLNITGILNNLNHYSLLTIYLKRLVELEPDYPSHMYDLAYAFEKLGELDNSIDYYRMYLDEEPYSDNAWYNLGLLYARKNMDNEALDAYGYSLAINPDNFFALFNKANILSKKGDFAEALDDYLHYLEYEEESAEAMTYAAECYGKLGRKDRAEKLFNDAIDLDPDFSEPWYGLGVMMLDTDPADSLRHLKKAISLKNDDAEYWYFLAEAYYRLRNPKDAIRSLIKSVNIDPYLDSAWLKMGQIIIDGSGYRHAVPFLEKGIKVLGDVHGLRYILASSYLYSGDRKMFMDHIGSAMIESSEFYSFFSSLFPEKLMDRESKKLIVKNLKTK